MKFSCDNVYENFENYKYNLVTGYNRFGDRNRKKVDNRLCNHNHSENFP